MSNDLPPTHSSPSDPYAAPAPQGAPAYAAPAGYGAPAAYGAPPAYAHWGKRVGASLLDGLVIMVGMIPMFVGVGMIAASQETTVDPATGLVETTGSPSAAAFAMIGLGFVVYIALWFWNRCWRQGRTGRSIGKSALGIRLVKEQTGQPAGAGLCLGREILHFLDGIFYLGYLWPLWDAKRQTFSDKIVSTVVLDD